MYVLQTLIVRRYFEYFFHWEIHYASDCRLCCQIEKSELALL